MIKLIVDPIVLTTLKQAMPKTNKAERALEKYISVLERHIDNSLMNARDNKFRFFKQFLLSTHDLSLEVGQFVIDGESQYLHKWLEVKKLNLIEVIYVGMKGSDPSTVKLSSLVKMNDAMDLQTLKKKTVNELDKLLNDKSLTDVDLFLINAFVTDVRRRAKVLLIDLSSNYTLVVHLKMTGQLILKMKLPPHPNPLLRGEGIYGIQETNALIQITIKMRSK